MKPENYKSSKNTHFMCGPKLVYVNLNEKFIKENKLNLIIGMPDCEACMCAHELMEKKNIEFKCACWQGNHTLIESIKKQHKHQTSPMIFLKGEFIGGFRELRSKLEG